MVHTAITISAIYPSQEKKTSFSEYSNSASVQTAVTIPAIHLPQWIFKLDFCTNCCNYLSHLSISIKNFLQWIFKFNFCANCCNYFSHSSIFSKNLLHRICNFCANSCNYLRPPPFLASGVEFWPLVYWDIYSAIHPSSAKTCFIEYATSVQTAVIISAPSLFEVLG